MIYPWHQSAWHDLSADLGRLPHALLLSGKAGIGKAAFAQHLAQTLLCENGGREACGICPSCHLYQQNGHPDFYLLTPEMPEGESETRKLLQIKISEVRAVIEKIQLTAVRGGRRVVLVEPAESMNIQAANALLKVLEEPPAGVHFILVSHARDKLLPTIKSRCRENLLPAPGYTEAAAYLAENGIQNAEALLAFHSGAPLFEAQPEQDALRERLAELLTAPRLLGILDFAADFDKKKWPLALFLDWLQKWLVDVGLAQQQLPPLYYPHHQTALAGVGRRTAAAALFDLNRRINLLHPYGRHTLSAKMQLEYLLTEYLSFWQNKSSCN
ncbi:DNA polymerase III subunit delta' [Neisseria leonii]|uniref:DNA polymerase III subunit delta' n=1 Tax=Neisseria leonii TaxID=2995413 RepID=UPI00237A7651|nr:DNA polymerase III subunit delta' [Neisseria sp. 3986]MDD9324958.1 DNA polymerase III subunit delta' [Neisseria sp. 3986]